MVFVTGFGSYRWGLSDSGKRCVQSTHDCGWIGAYCHMNLRSFASHYLKLVTLMMPEESLTYETMLILSHFRDLGAGLRGATTVCENTAKMRSRGD
jgi:hypothetical protein